MTAPTTYGDDADLWGWQEQDDLEDQMRAEDGYRPKVRLLRSQGSRRPEINLPDGLSFAERVRLGGEILRKSRVYPVGSYLFEIYGKPCAKCGLSDEGIQRARYKSDEEWEAATVCQTCQWKAEREG